MSKPRPFIRSFWGLASILLLAIIILGINNYRNNLAGFPVPYQKWAVAAVRHRPLADPAYVISTAADLDKLVTLSGTTRPDFTKQIGLLAADPALRPTSITRQGTLVEIHCLRDTTATQPTLLTVDRTRLIASSTLSINFLIGNQITAALQLSPDQI